MADEDVLLRQVLSDHGVANSDLVAQEILSALRVDGLELISSDDVFGATMCPHCHGDEPLGDVDEDGACLACEGFGEIVVLRISD